MRSPKSAGLGRRRRTCQTMMLMDRILRAGETANRIFLDCPQPGRLQPVSQLAVVEL